MKKFLVFFLLTLYMGTATGATFRMHYCKGQLVDVELTAGDDGQCSLCGAKTAGECCKSEHRTVKLEKDQQASANATLSLPAAAILLPVSLLTLAGNGAAAVVTTPQAGYRPPACSKVHSTILHCVFRV